MLVHRAGFALRTPPVYYRPSRAPIEKHLFAAPPAPACHLTTGVTKGRSAGEPNSDFASKCVLYRLFCSVNIAATCHASLTGDNCLHPQRERPIWQTLSICSCHCLLLAQLTFALVPVLCV